MGDKDKSTVHVKLTKVAVDKATRGDRTQRLYFDTDLTGFGLCVGATAKTFFVQREVRGKSVRATIGRYGVFTVDEARREARQKLAQMALGRDPVAEKRAARARGVTFGEAAREYIEDNRRRLSPETISGYERMLKNYLDGWDRVPLVEIEPWDVYEKHKAIAAEVAKRQGPGRGGYAANGAIRFFRAVYNDAAGKHPQLPANPARVMRRKYAPEIRRKSALPPEALARWYRAIMKMENPIRRDYLRLVLFTGLRRTSATEIRWEHVDLDARTLHLPRPKGGEERAFTLPLSNYLVELLTARHAENETVFPKSPWVFPSLSESGHITEPKEELTDPDDDSKEPKALDVKWNIHALRNTFTTVAEHVAGIPRTVVKVLLNHKTQDVTEGYSNPTVEHLRPAMQNITNSLQAICEGPGDVVALPILGSAASGSVGQRLQPGGKG